MVPNLTDNNAPYTRGVTHAQAPIAPHVRIVDQTMREGMQYRGIMLDLDQRRRILDFQNALGVDASEVGYPPAHKWERDIVEALTVHADAFGYQTAITALCRAIKSDVLLTLECGAKHVSMHSLPPSHGRYSESTIEAIGESVHTATRATSNLGSVAVTLTDVAKLPPESLATSVYRLCVAFGLKTIGLADSSGLLSPSEFSAVVSAAIAAWPSGDGQVAVHCHNDFGLASANTIAGVEAGARTARVSALGIGERNGIGDLFVVSKTLARLGYHISVDTTNEDLFKQYYEYVDGLCYKQTGTHLLHENTPYFGSNTKTYVAGTHGVTTYGPHADGEIFLNILCGKHLVRRFLECHDIPFTEGSLGKVVERIKDCSARRKRRLDAQEVRSMVGDMS